MIFSFNGKYQSKFVHYVPVYKYNIMYLTCKYKY